METGKEEGGVTPSKGEGAEEDTTSPSSPPRGKGEGKAGPMVDIISGIACIACIAAAAAAAPPSPLGAPIEGIASFDEWLNLQLWVHTSEAQGGKSKRRGP